MSYRNFSTVANNQPAAEGQPRATATTTPTADAGVSDSAAGTPPQRPTAAGARPTLELRAHDRFKAQRLAQKIVRIFFPDVPQAEEIKRLRQQILRDQSLRSLPDSGKGFERRFGPAEIYQWVARIYPDHVDDVKLVGRVITSATLKEPLSVRFGLSVTGIKLHTDIDKANAEIQRLRKHNTKLRVLLRRFRDKNSL